MIQIGLLQHRLLLLLLSSCHHIGGMFNYGNFIYVVYNEPDKSRQSSLKAVTGIRSKIALLRNSRHSGFAPRLINLISFISGRHLGLHHRSTWGMVSHVLFTTVDIALIDFPSWFNLILIRITDPPTATYWVFSSHQFRPSCRRPNSSKEFSLDRCRIL